MITLSKSVTIKAPRKKVIDFLSNPENMAIILPNVIRNYNISKGSIKPGWKFDWEFSLMGMPFKGKWTAVEYDGSKKYVAKTEGMIDSTWDYTFSEKNGKTGIKVTVDYYLPKVLSNKFAEHVVKKVNEKDLERYLHNLKVLLEG